MATDWKTWDEFFTDVFGSPYDVWHDGLDVSRVRSLEGEARVNALRMLRLGLERNDPVAAQAIRELGGEELVPELEAKLAGSSGTNRVELAVTLFEITGEQRYASPIVDVLESGAHWSVVIVAAIALRRFRGPAVEAALLRAIEADDYLVRNHAAESLLAIRGVEPKEISQHPEIFENIVGPPDEQPLTAADRAKFAQAAEQLRALYASTPRASTDS